MHRTIISNEPQPNTTSDNSIVGEVSTPTKAEITIAETPEAIHTPVIDNSHVTMSTRASARLSREYITQHISYRAQRHAAKVEPHMVCFILLPFFLNIRSDFIDNTKTSCSNT